MKIGIDCNSLTRKLTGVGTYLLDSLRYLAEIDKEDTFYLYMNESAKCKLPENEQFIVRYINAGDVIWYMCLLPIQMKKDSLDLFWEPGNRLPVIPKNTRIVTTIHDLASYMFPKYCSWKTALMERLFLEKTVKKSDKLIAISNSTKDDIINVFGISPEKIDVIYNGDTPYRNIREYDDEKKNDILKKYNIFSSYFLCIGSINPRKNLEVILKAFFEYRERGGTALLVIAGKTISKADRITEIVRKSSHGKHVRFVGYVSEIEKEYLYKYSKSLLFPSRYEGFGFPIIEAMSLGVLVITSSVSSMPEVGGEAAIYLHDIDDYHELSILLEYVDNMSIEEKHRRQVLGYENVKRFSRKNATQGLVKIFWEKKY